MIKNFFTLAIRNLLKRRMYSFINVFGLAIGIAVCLVILKYIDFELSYDRFHANAKTIYRMTTTSYQQGESKGTGIISGYALGPAMQSDLPEVKAYIRTHPMYGGAVANYKNKTGDAMIFREESMQFADSTFFDAFTYQAINGKLSTAMIKPNAVVITRKIAEKYFGNTNDALGKIFQISGGWADGDYEVTSVIENIPENSHFTFDFIFPIHNLLRNGQYKQDDGWGWNNFVTYIQLHPNVKVSSLKEKMAALVEKYRGKDLAETKSKVVYNFQSIVDIHLTPGYRYESSPTISESTIYFFITISIFILAIAWVNYINLSTARAVERAREVGIKKSIGAFRHQIISQFLFESFLINLLGIIIAIALALLLLPVLGNIVGKNLVFDFSDYRFWVIIFGLLTAGSIISGAYPAFFLSSFSIIRVLKGGAEKIGGGFTLRKALVVFQFASSLILIAGTFAIYRQVMYMRNQDKGLTTEQMLIVDGPKVLSWQNPKQTKQKLITFKHNLQQINGVLDAASSGAIPGGGHNWGTMIRKDGDQREDNKSGRIVWVDPDFIKTYGITVLTGRSFNPEIKSDMESVLVNEAALKAFGLGTPEEALKERLILGSDTVAILGILKNYHWESLKTDHSPWLFKADTISTQRFSLHLASANMHNTLTEVEKVFKETFPGNPFDYYFLDDFFNKQYKGEQQFAKIFSLFAILAIVIACLGLWGLASFTTSQKLKEISVRKVLGASVPNIVTLLSWQFLQLVLIASVIAVPLTWFGIDQWLTGFAFRIGLHWDLFVVPVVILGLIAFITVSVQIFRGASINPAKVLRSE